MTMASKKKDFNLAAQGMAFIGQDKEQEQPDARENAVDETEGREAKTARRRMNPGKMWRANLLLDADLQEPIMIQALRAGKNVSLFINDILKDYINNTSI